MQPKRRSDEENTDSLTLLNNSYKYIHMKSYLYKGKELMNCAFQTSDQILFIYNCRHVNQNK